MFTRTLPVLYLSSTSSFSCIYLPLQPPNFRHLVSCGWDRRLAELCGGSQRQLHRGGRAQIKSPCTAPQLVGLGGCVYRVAPRGIHGVGVRDLARDFRGVHLCVHRPQSGHDSGRVFVHFEHQFGPGSWYGAGLAMDCGSY